MRFTLGVLALAATLVAAAFLVAGKSETVSGLNEIYLTITLGPGRDALQIGTATLVGGGSPKEVAIEIAPGPPGVEQPAHIHAGTCPNVGEVVYPLNNVVDGTSTTTIGANLELLDPNLELLPTGTFAIDVHKSEADIALQVACGDIRYEEHTIEFGTPVIATDAGPQEVQLESNLPVLTRTPTPALTTAPTPTPEPALIQTSEPPTPLAASATSNPADDDSVSPFWFVLGGVGGAVVLLGGASIIWHYRRVR